MRKCRQRAYVCIASESSPVASAERSRTGNLDLVDPVTLAVDAVSGFSQSATFTKGSHTSGCTSADEGGSVVYAIDHETTEVRVVDPKTRSITQATTLAADPDYVRYVGTTRELWLTQPLTGIEVLSVPPSGAPTHAATIPITGGPEAIAVDGTRGRVYTNSFGGNTYAVDIATRAVTDRPAFRAARVRARPRGVRAQRCRSRRARQTRSLSRDLCRRRVARGVLGGSPIGRLGAPLEGNPMNDKQLIEQNLVVITERAPDVVGRFYTRLFTSHPELERLFSRRSRPAQEKMVLDAIVAVVEHMEDAGWLRSVLRPLGAKHVSYGVTDAMYPRVAEALVATLAESSGATWDESTERAWVRALTAVAGEMIAGAHDAVDEDAASTQRTAEAPTSQS